MKFQNIIFNAEFFPASKMQTINRLNRRKPRQPIIGKTFKRIEKPKYPILSSRENFITITGKVTWGTKKDMYGGELKFDPSKQATSWGNVTYRKLRKLWVEV